MIRLKALRVQILQSIIYAMAETINQVRNEGLKSRCQLEKALQKKQVNPKTLTDIKEIEKNIDSKNQMMENRYIIGQYKEIHKYAKENPEDKAFLNEYGPQLMLYKKALLKVSRALIFCPLASKYRRP